MKGSKKKEKTWSLIWNIGMQKIKEFPLSSIIIGAKIGVETEASFPNRSFKGITRPFLGHLLPDPYLTHQNKWVSMLSDLFQFWPKFFTISHSFSIRLR